MADRLDNRTLNRTLLARQYLLQRTESSLADVLEHLIGLQAQDVLPPFVGLWSRMRDFDPETVSAGLDDRSLARITLMRGTIHLVTARDAVRIAGQIQPLLEKAPFRNGFHYGATVGMDRERLRTRGLRLFTDEPIAATALRAAVASEWPDRDAQAVMQALLYLLPVMQTPPRGRWLRNDKPTWSLIEPWLGRPLEPDYPVSELVLRYLRAFGPASSMDIQTWSRLTGLREIVESLGDRVRSYTDEAGRTLYDAADAELAAPDLDAPVRYLGWFDNALLSHKDRTRIVPEGARITLATMAANRSTVLVDGFVAGFYKVVVEGDRATLRLAPLATPTKKLARQLEAEALRLVGFLHAGKTAAFELDP